MKTKLAPINATTKACQIPFRIGNMNYGVLDIPAGLRCSMIQEGGTKGQFFLDEFPSNIFPTGSIILHDATYHGINLTADQVELVK